jgi:hypothetical protein
MNNALPDDGVTAPKHVGANALVVSTLIKIKLKIKSY